MWRDARDGFTRIRRETVPPARPRSYDDVRAALATVGLGRPRIVGNTDLF